MCVVVNGSGYNMTVERLFLKLPVNALKRTKQSCFSMMFEWHLNDIKMTFNECLLRF